MAVGGIITAIAVGEARLAGSEVRAQAEPILAKLASRGVRTGQAVGNASWLATAMIAAGRITFCASVADAGGGAVDTVAKPTHKFTSCRIAA